VTDTAPRASLLLGVELLGHALAVLVAVRLRLPDGPGQPPT
jgi:hypothetical protein